MKITKRNMGAMALVALGALSLASCNEEVKIPTSYEDIAADIRGRFDYNSWRTYDLKVNVGSKSHIKLYDSDPVANKDANVITEFFTDASGKYNGTIQVGSSLLEDDLYAEVNGKMLLSSKLTKKGVEFVTKGSRDGEDDEYTYGYYADDHTVCARLGNYLHQVLPEGQDNFKKGHSGGLCDYANLEWREDGYGGNPSYHAGWWYENGQVDQQFITTTEDTEVTINMIKFGEVNSDPKKACRVSLYYYYIDGDKLTNQIYQQPVYFYHTFACDKFRITPQSHDITYDGHTLKPESYDFWEQHEHHGGTDGTWNTSAQFENNTMENWLADPAVGYEVKLKYYGPVDKSKDSRIDYYDYQQVLGHANPDKWGFGFQNEEEGTTTFPAGVSIGFFLMLEYTGGHVEYMVMSEPDRGDFLAVFTPNWLEANNEMLTWYNDHGNYTHYKPMYCARFDANSEGYWPEDVSPVGIENGQTLTRMVYTWEDALSGPGETPSLACSDDDQLDFNDYMFMLTLGSPGTKTFTESNYVNHVGTYIFEDLYPESGDYDMNDVIIKYQYQFWMDEDNTITDMQYSFEPLWDGATYINQFWIGFTDETNNIVQKVYANNQRVVSQHKTFVGSANLINGEISASKNYGSSIEEDAFASFFIGKKYSHDLFQKLSGDAFDTHYGINPFIYVDDTDEQVHLAKYPWVDLASAGVTCAAPDNEYSRLFVVNPNDTKYQEGAIMPFAIDLAWCTKFQDTPEGTPIFNFYDDFMNWCLFPDNANYTSWFKQHERNWNVDYWGKE